MIIYIIHIAYCALGIMGVHFAFKPNELFGRASDWLQDRLPLWLVKPLFLCPMCMASFWGIVYLLVCVEWKLYALWIIPAVTGLLAITCAMLSRNDDNACE